MSEHNHHFEIPGSQAGLLVQCEVTGGKSMPGTAAGRLCAHGAGLESKAAGGCGGSG